MSETTQTELPDGIHKLPMEAYRAAPGISKLALDIFHDCLADYEAYLDGRLPSRTTDAMEYGTLLHALVLDEPLRFHVHPATYGPDAKKWNNSATECKEWNAAHSDRAVLSPAEATALNATASAVRRDPKAKRLLDAAELTEASCFVTDAATRLRLKGRPDIIGPDFICDLKTAADASTWAFAGSIGKYRYHVQAAMYRRILGQLGRDTKHWYFIVVESGSWPRVNVRRLTDLAIVQGEVDLESDLAQLQECMEDGCWPGLSGASPDIEPIDIPMRYYTEAKVELNIGGATLTM